MDEDEYTGVRPGADRDSDSNDSSVDSDSPGYILTTPAQISQSNPVHNKTTGRDGSKKVETATGSDDDDTSSVDRSSEEENDNTTSVPIERSRVESEITSHYPDRPSMVQTRAVTHDKKLEPQTEAARLKARLGLISIVDSVAIRKKFRDKLPQNQLYDDIGQMVTDTGDGAREDTDNIERTTERDITPYSPHLSKDTSDDKDSESPISHKSPVDSNNDNLNKTSESQQSSKHNRIDKDHETPSLHQPSKDDNIDDKTPPAKHQLTKGETADKTPVLNQQSTDDDSGDDVDHSVTVNNNKVDNNNSSDSEPESTKDEGSKSKITTNVKVNHKVRAHVTNALQETELRDMAEAGDSLSDEENERGVGSTCCCFRRSKES